MSFELRKTYPEIFHNLRVKVYPNGEQEYLLCRDNIFRESGWEQSEKWEADPHSASDSPDVEGNLLRAKRRAKAAVRDLALSNEFNSFVTLTLDASRVDRYDIDAVIKTMNNWLDNNVRRKGLKYILVPELHKDGAIHFHGFINDALPLVDSGTLSTGEGKPRKPRSSKERQRFIDDGAHVVYNLPSWKLGFSTAIELYGEYRRAVAYVCKYISKEQQKIGGRWYYSGGDLKRPEVYYDTVDYDQFLSVNNEPSYSFKSIGTEFVGFISEGV